MGHFRYSCLTTRPDGSTHRHEDTQSLPYPHNGRWYGATNIGEVIAAWNRRGADVKRLDGLVNRYEYTLLEVVTVDA